MSRLRNITFDDRDRGNLRYAGSWFFEGSYIASNTGDSGTLASSSDLEANVTFTFPEPAVAFYYFGIPRSGGGFYGICIDCDPNARTFQDIDAFNATDDGKNPPVVLFSTRFSNPGVHEIILRNQNDTRTGRSQITVDRFVLEVVDQTPVSTVVVPISSTPTPTTVSTARNPNSNAAQTPRTSASTSPRRSMSPGTVVGLSLSAVAVLIVLFLLVFWWRLRRRRQKLANNRLSMISNTEATPFPLYASPDTTEAMRQINGSNGTNLDHRPTLSISTNSFPLTSLSGPSSNSHLSLLNVTPRRERDAGSIPYQDEDGESVLPPDYADVFDASRNSLRPRPSSSAPSSSTGTQGLAALTPLSAHPSKRRKA